SLDPCALGDLRPQRAIQGGQGLLGAFPIRDVSHRSPDRKHRTIGTEDRVVTEDEVPLFRRLRGASESNLSPVYGPSCRENLLDIGFDRFRNVREEIMKLPSEMLLDRQAVDVHKILVDPDAPKV